MFIDAPNYESEDDEQEEYIKHSDIVLTDENIDEAFKLINNL